MNLQLTPRQNNFSRRQFLSKGGLALSLAPALGASCMSLLPRRVRAAEPGANDKIRLGLIGCGGRGRDVLGVFLSHPEVDCPVVCDVDDRMLIRAATDVEEKRGKAPDRVKDFRRVLDRNDVDCVLVATPDHWHALPTIFACQAGKDVYVEKPLAKTIVEGRAMLEASRQYQRVVQMGTQWRSGEHQKDAVEFVKSGQLGKIGIVRGWAYLDWISGIGKPSDCAPPTGVDYDMWLGPAPSRPFNPNRFHFNFRWFWDYAGGLMTDWGVHLINIMMWAMGPDHPRNISSTGGRFVLDDNRETPDTQVTTYEFPHYTLLWEHRVGSNNGPYNKEWGIVFNGSAGTLMITADGWEVIPERKQHELQAIKKPQGGDERFPHVKNFLDCMKSRQQPNENLELGHHVTTVAHLGNIALRVGRKINWDPEKERIPGDAQADRLVTAEYRKPWKLPHTRKV
jgi:predicted dehydrogenase